MNIAIIAHNPLFPIGDFKPHGGEFSTREIAEYLVKKGHRVTMIQFHPDEGIREISGVKYITWASRETADIEKLVRPIKTDVLFTWSREVLVTHKLSLKMGIPYVTFVRRFQTLISGHYLYTIWFRLLTILPSTLAIILDEPLRTFVRASNFLPGFRSPLAVAFIKADLIFSNSQYTATLVKRFYGTDSIVSYPYVDTQKYKVDTPGDCITTIGKSRQSGHDLIEKLAALMPQQKFLSVGHYRESPCPNLTVIREYVDDVREIYRQTKILLSARRNPEPFGRVPLEAAVSGIPSVASDIGGLPEAIGQGGILLPPNANLQEWASAITKVLDDYDTYSRKALTHATTFDAEHQLNIVLEGLERIANRKLDS